MARTVQGNDGADTSKPQDIHIQLTPANDQSNIHLPPSMVFFHQSRRKHQESEDSYRKALELDPGNEKAVIGITSLLNSSNRFKESLAILNSLPVESAKGIDFHNQRGLTLIGLGRLEESLESLQIAQKLSPGDIRTNLNISFCFLKQKRYEEAIKTAAAVLVERPDNIQGIQLLGEGYAAIQGFSQAALCYSRICELESKFTDRNHLTLAEYLYKANDSAKAEAIYQDMLSRNPINSEAAFRLANIFVERGELRRGIKQLKMLLDGVPESASAHNNLAMIFVKENDIEKAFEHFELALYYCPEFYLSYINRAHLHREIGDIDKAVNDYRNALAINPEFLPTYFFLSCCISAEDQPESLEECLNIYAKTKGKEDQYYLDFAIGKYYKDLGDEQGFQYLMLANQKKFKSLDWNRPNWSRINHGVSALLGAATSISTLQILPSATMGSDPGKCALDESKFIFIIGLPRCGSTLVETILSMNPKVESLGEVDCLRKSIEALAESLKKGVVSDLKEIYFSEINKLANTHHDVNVYTDKMLTNFIYGDLIARYMPNAKIVHVHRSIMDNVLSVYSSNFAVGNEWSFDLDEIYNFISSYSSAVKELRERYPDLIYDCNYDLLVKDFSVFIPKLVENCGMDWDDSYLSPEKSKRKVLTASAVQVRNPIHSKSVGGWRRYEQYLSPLADRLKDLGFAI